MERWLSDYVNDVLERVEDVKRSEQGDWRDAQLLAYSAALTLLKASVTSIDPDNVGEYGLDIDIDEKVLFI